MFVSTFRFTASSLDALVKNLAKDQFRETAKFFPPDKLELLMKERVYSYDYMDSWKNR